MLLPAIPMKPIIDTVVTPHFVGDGTGLYSPESGLVTTCRLHRFFFFLSRSHTSVVSDCKTYSGAPFALWWTTDDPVTLRLIHDDVVSVIRRIGFAQPATWQGNGLPEQMDFFWRGHLGDSYRYYQKTTS